MHIEQIYTGCLAHGAYFISSNGEAAVVDPLRETEPYLQRAKDLGVKIKYVLETHFHADFVSGHLALAEAAGAEVVFGPTAKAEFDLRVAEDGEMLPLGDINIKVLHTPGHTMESSCFLVVDENGKDHSLFSGDTLFLGDVGRPDLAQKAANMTQEELAGTLYDSLRDKIMTLDPKVIVYPGHGAGSACGKNMSKETVGTIGYELKNNYALRKNMTKDEFIKEVLAGLTTPPQYFGMNVGMNKSVIRSFDDIVKDAETSLAPEAFKALAQQLDAVILDVREADDWAEAHIPGSINIGLEGQFAPWVGAMIPTDSNLLLVTPKGVENETIMRLSRIGYDNVHGYLEGGIAAWNQAKLDTDSQKRVNADEFVMAAKAGARVLDVRRIGEFRSQRVHGASHIPLDDLNARFGEVPEGTEDQPIYIHCAGGYRSSVFASILKARGLHHTVDVRGGFSDIANVKGAPVTDYICPSTIDDDGNPIPQKSGFRSWLSKVFG